MQADAEEADDDDGQPVQNMTAKSLHKLIADSVTKSLQGLSLQTGAEGGYLSTVELGALRTYEHDALVNLVPAPEHDALQARLQSAAARTNVNSTDKQRQNGDYQKGRVEIQGLKIAIENPAGSVRSGVSPEGKPWSQTMNNHYGYIEVVRRDKLHSITKTFNEDDHPRGDDGKFIAGAAIEKAKSNPKLADKLRAKVTDPKQRKALEEMLGGAKAQSTTVPVNAEKVEGLQNEIKRMSDVIKNRGGEASDDIKAIWNDNLAKSKAELAALTGGPAVKEERGAAPLVTSNVLDKVLDGPNHKFAKAKNAADWENKHFGDVTSKLKPEEVDAVNTYTGGRFSNINDGLRGTEKLDGTDKATIKGLDSAMMKSKLPEAVTVYRGMTSLEHFGDLNKLMGQTIAEKGYMSTSIMPGVANGFARKGEAGGPVGRWEISLPAGTNTLSTDTILGKDSLHQHELILPRGSSYKVTGVEEKKPGFFVIKAEIVGKGVSGGKPKHDNQSDSIFAKRGVKKQ